MTPHNETEARKRLVEEKTCLRCHNIKPLSDFYRNRSRSDGHQNWCKSCQLKNQTEYMKNSKTLEHYRELARERSHRIGLHRPMSEANDCGLYLGVCVAEKLLREVFENVEQMPHGNPGYDFVCKRGRKIDVKSACRSLRSGKADTWNFHIDKNQIADYFLCLAFDSRESLKPEHMWLIPGTALCNKQVASIAENRLEKWSTYERSIQAVVSHCDNMKAAV